MVSILRAVMCRKLYNRKMYNAAINTATPLVKSKKYSKFAKDLILRSMYNLSLYEELVTKASFWNVPNDEDIVARSFEVLWKEQPHLYPLPLRLVSLQNEQPLPIEMFDWNPDDQVENFKQEGKRVWFRTEKSYVYWDVPGGFSLEATHPNLLHLVAEVLHPIRQKGIPDGLRKRMKGSKVSLSYSGGTDSTAAMVLMPQDTILAYHRRSFDSLLEHKKANKLFACIDKYENRKVFEIPSNHEVLRTYYGKPVGFSTDFACASHLILLADYFNLGGIAFGMPLDNSFLWKGRTFRNFLKLDSYQYWRERFSHAGLDYILPLCSVSEAGAMKICASSIYAEFVNSCMRGDGYEGCGTCWKCFIKNGPINRPFDFNSVEVQTYLNTRPMPTATHALWAIKEMNLEHLVSDLSHLLDADYSWWLGYYPPGFQLLPSSLRNEIETNVKRYLTQMPEPFSLESIDHFNETTV